MRTAIALLGMTALACGTSGKNGHSGSTAMGGTTSTTEGDAAGNAEGAAPEPCPGGGLSPGDHSFTLTHAGVDYAYEVHVPSGYDDTHPVPLVLNWHGLGMNADMERILTGMDTVSDAHGFIVVYPTAPDATWNSGTCTTSKRDDVGFARALVAEMRNKACIDPKRVYSTGFSNGGFLSHRLACEAADLVAAIAPVAALMCLPSCTPSRPVPILAFHGTGDTDVPYENGTMVPTDAQATLGTLPETIQDWADRDGCTAGPTETFAKDDAHRMDWTGCKDGVDVGYYRLDGMGHCWPGQPYCAPGGLLPAAASLTVNASEEIAKFFERFRLP